MSEVIAEHEWKNEDGEKVMKVVGSVIEMQKKVSLPKGFALNGIQPVSGNNRGILHGMHVAVRHFQNYSVNCPLQQFTESSA